MKRNSISFVLGSLSLILVSCDGGGDDANNVSVTANSTTALPNNFSDVSDINPLSSGTAASTGDESSLKIEVANKINAHRLGEGITPSTLIEDNNIVQLARLHNLYMAEQAKIARDGGNTGIIISHDNFADRANSIFALGYNQVGENIAANRGYDVVDVANVFVSEWITSAPHRANIETPFTHTGIDVYVDPADNTVYATQLFARLP